MFENVGMALESLRSNKMRSFLTMIGIIIGIGAVIGIMSMGKAMTSMVDSQMGQFGMYNVYVSMKTKAESFTADDALDYNFSVDDKDLMTMKQIEAMEGQFTDLIDAVDIAGGQLSGYQAKDGNAYGNINISGVSPGNQKVNDVKMQKGHFINDSEVKSQRMVCVISDKLATALFSKTDPLGQVIRAYGNEGILELTVVGVYTYTPSPYDRQNVPDKDIVTSIYVPVTTFKNNWDVNKNYSSLSIKLKPGIDLEDATQKINAFWEREYRMNNEVSAYAFNQQSMVDQSMTMMSTIQTVLSVIAGISLLVGGIGVMNIMLVSVTERTHEIGIRKALGALDSQIRFQFVTEAAILCLTGGLIGIVLGQGLGWLGATLIASLSDMESVQGGVSIGFMAGTVLFSITIGVFFGLYPANKAAKLDPIDALRYE